MKTALIILLGNRDIQISNKRLADIKGQFYNYFVTNNEDENYSIIDKFDKSRTGKTFREITEEFWNEKDYIFRYIDFLLWDKTWKELQKSKIELDKIFITSSKQVQPFKQDCDFVAMLLKEKLEGQGFNCELKLCEHNPTDFEKMANFYSSLYDNVATKYQKIFISNSGGTPQMRTASHFAGIFRNFNFIAISSSDTNTTKTFQQQENLILKNIIQKMLDVYDYAGIDDLPINNKKVKFLAKYALARILLNHNQAITEINNILHISDENFYVRLKTEIDKDFTIQDLERELFLSAKIKFRQKAYADYLWRLFTIQDNMLIPILEEYFGEQIIFNKPNHPEWNLLIDNNPKLKEHLDTIKFGKQTLNYSFPNKFAYKQIYKFISQNNPDVIIESVDSILTNLGDLRNSIAHSYGSVDIENLNKNIPIKPLRKALKILFPDLSEKELEAKLISQDKVVLFNLLLNNYLNIEETSFEIFDQINKKIISLL